MRTLSASDEARRAAYCSKRTYRTVDAARQDALSAFEEVFRTVCI
jgi:hypothetical protein